MKNNLNRINLSFKKELKDRIPIVYLKMQCKKINNNPKEKSIGKIIYLNKGLKIGRRITEFYKQIVLVK
ncbi:MAG: hypothetical protein RBR32_12185 [Bacteroidales bacterium]|nr:hypothetical protein [Bacteroidales bacterium]